MPLVLAASLLIGCPLAATKPAPSGGTAMESTPVSVATPDSTPTSASGESDVATPEAAKVRLRWYSFYQENVARFEVYRGPSREGPWERVSTEAQLLMGQGFYQAENPDDAPEYVFEDTDVSDGQTYWYYIGKVDLVGRRARYTRHPIMAVARAQRAGQAEPTVARVRVAPPPPVPGRMPTPPPPLATPAPTPTPAPAQPLPTPSPSFPAPAEAGLETF